MIKKIIFIILLHVGVLQAQTALVKGHVVDQSGKPVENATISLLGDAQNPVYSNKDGFYEYTVPANKSITLVIAVLNFKQERVKLNLKLGEVKELESKLSGGVKQIDSVEVVDYSDRASGNMRLDPKIINNIPSTSQDFNTILFSQPGVTNRNELSSQYSVRGGNFDENLVYVNDIEIYRPFLTRSGQQEGLSFVNGDMVSSVLFSAGGFEAKYGDKMSSVLDIKYRQPRKFAGTVSASALGGNAHLEGASKDLRFTWIVGARYKNSRYILGGLETQGQYTPAFTDLQTYLTFDITDKWELDFLGNFAINKYIVKPETRETDFGTINQALRLKVYFDGQEIDQFQTGTGALSLIFRPNPKTTLKFIGSAFNSTETESFDIQGQYYIDELEADFGKPSFGEVKANRGVGTFLDHTRNRLFANVFNLEHKGQYVNGKNQWLWGVKAQTESIYDQLSEWKYVDSAGYSLPYYPLTSIDLQDVVKSKRETNSNRINGYAERIWTFETRDTSEIILTAGVRSSYWTLNEQVIVSPRLTLAFKPNWKRNFLFRFSSGYYTQPPFYRELRDFDGVIHKDVKAQTSIHFLLGGDYSFKAWNRPFKFTTEVYYKLMDNLVPYEVDNVRIRYFAKNNASGYARGVDFKINGEFVKGAESWASMSLLQTYENIKDDYYYDYYNAAHEKIIPGYTYDTKKADSVRHEPGEIPRPTDQLLSFGLFFQDYLPKLPSCKMYLSLFFGTPMPFGPPSHDRYKDTLRMPPYRRVDIGFSYEFIRESKPLPKSNVFHVFRSAAVSLEVLNLLQVNNTVSYLWIKDVTNRQYAIPNYLTSRQINARLIFKF